MIRQVEIADIPGITHVRTSVRENHMSVEEMAAIGITPDLMKSEMQSGDLCGWLAEEEGAIVAFAEANRRTANLWALFTLPGHEGRGYGSALLARAEDWLQQQGCSVVNLYTERGSRAVDFYSRRGWSAYEPPDADPRDVYMRKVL